LFSREDLHGLWKLLIFLPGFLAYVLRNFLSAKFALVVTVLGVMFEYFALSVMLPLASSQGQGAGIVSSVVVDAWGYVAFWLGFADEPRTWLFFFLFMLGIRIAIGFVQIGLNTWVSKNIMAHLSAEVFSRVLFKESLANVYQHTIGHFIALAGDEAFRLGQVFFNVAQTLSALMAAIIGLIVLTALSPDALKLTLLFLLLSGVCIFANMLKILSWSRESAQLSRNLNTTFIEGLNGIRSIRSMGGEEYVVKRYKTSIDRYGRVLFLLDIFNHGSRTIPGLILILLGLIALHPSTGLLQEFSAIYFFTVTTMLIRVLSFLGTAVSSGGRAVIDIRAAYDVEEIIGHNSADETVTLTGKLVTSVNNIRMSNLFFGYVAAEPILRKVSAQLSAGRSYALVGKSGSGKSTLSDVLLGLLPPMSGDLLIDCLPYDQLNLASLRRRVVLVEQQTRIFSGSVRENIEFGLSPSDREMQLAIKTAGLGEFIDSLPRGLDTRLDYQGANFSGGQRQRIGLARAILRKPDVLILDESTSALDEDTREVVLRNLKELFREKILLFITHDSHVIQAVDEVWQIKGDKLIIK